MKIKKMEKEKIGIDIDEVVAGFMQGYLEFHNKRHNSNIILENIKNYHLWECGVHSSKEDSVKEVLDFQNSEIFDNIGLIDGAKRGIIQISRGYNPYFITSRPEIIKQKTFDFFYNNFPKNGYEFIFSGEIYGGKTKSEICKELGIKKMIEDNPNYALDCAKNGIQAFLLDKPWNKNYEKHENIIKVNNWNELLEKLNLTN